MPSLRALTAFAATTFYAIAASPVTLALAAGTQTVKDPYGERTPLDLEKVTTSAAEAPGASSGAVAKTVVGLAVVIAVIYGLTWVLKQLKASSSDTGFGGLSTEASVPLGPNRSLHLIRAGRELVLVGSAEHGVTPIRTYSESEALELGLIGTEDDAGTESPATQRPKLPGIATVVPALERMRERTLR